MKPCLMLLPLLLLLSMWCAPAGAEEAALAAESGGSAGRRDPQFERRIVASLTGLGGVLIAIAVVMMSTSGSAMSGSEEDWDRDHAEGAVDALLNRTEAEERRGGSSDSHRAVRQRLRETLLDEIPPYDPIDRDGRVEEQKKIDTFFKQDVTDDWLMDKLIEAQYEIGGRVFERQTRCPCCVGWKSLWLRDIHATGAQSREYRRMRARLRLYIRDNLYITGRLEPVWRRPAAEAAKRLFKSAVAIFDFGSDVFACHSMYVGVAEQSLAVAAILWLTLSTVLSTVGTCYFTFKATERVNAEAKPRRIADQDKLQTKPSKYCIVVFGAMTNPEILQHMAWYSQPSPLSVLECCFGPSSAACTHRSRHPCVVSGGTEKR